MVIGSYIRPRHITNKILESMDRKKVTALVLIDISKAFDSIDHVILFRKLQSTGVSRFAMDWFKSYLSDRSQCVRIGSMASRARTVSRGVPQGSILGTLLFNIYINDLPNVTKESQLESYVDDSKIFLSFPIVDAESAVTKLSEDMDRKLTGTQQMLERLPENFHITVLDKEIRPVLDAKDLGMLLDSRLSYDEQITRVGSTCIAELCQINRVKHITIYLDKRILTYIINALIFSRMYYCSSFGRIPQRKILPSYKVFRTLARIVSGARKYDHVTPLLQSLG